MPGLGEHALDHFHGIVPLPIDAGVHELVARSRAGTMRRNNLCDDGSEFVGHLHINLTQRGSAQPAFENGCIHLSFRARDLLLPNAFISRLYL
jgi:hypothetical protein